MKVTLSMHSGKPDKDGCYVVIEPGIESPFRFREMTYTVEGGWCTHRRPDGTLFVAEGHDPKFWDDIICWCPVNQYRIDGNKDIEDTLFMIGSELDDAIMEYEQKNEELAEALDYAREYIDSAKDVLRRSES